MGKKDGKSVKKDSTTVELACDADLNSKWRATTSGKTPSSLITVEEAQKIANNQS